MDSNTLKDIEKEINSFIWYNKKQLVSKEKCKFDRLKGGLGSIDIDTKCKTMRVQWLWRIYGEKEEGNNDWKILGRFFIDKCNKTIGDIRVTCVEINYGLENREVPSFYLETIGTWRRLKFQRKDLVDRQQILNEYLWANPLIKSNEQTLIDIKWILGGIYNVGDIWNSTSQNFKTKLEVREKLSRERPFYRFDISFDNVYNKLITSCPRKWVDILKQPANEEDNNIISTLWLKDIFKIDIKNFETKTIYERYLEKSGDINPLPSWTRDINIVDLESERKTFLNVLKTAELSNVLKELVWKIYHKGLPVGKLTKEWFPNETGVCRLCNKVEETHVHLFLKCEFTEKALHWVNTKFDLGNTQKLTEIEVFLNGGSVEINLFLMKAIFKKAIWDTRNSAVFDNSIVTFDAFKSRFINRLKIELETIMLVNKNKNQFENFKNKYRFNNIDYDEQNEKVVML